MIDLHPFFVEAKMVGIAIKRNCRKT